MAARRHCPALIFMPKKTKLPKVELKKKDYIVSVTRNRFKKNVRVMVQDNTFPAEHCLLSLEISGLTKVNVKNDTTLFNLMHYAIAHVIHERFPDSSEELHAYNDSFFTDMHTMSVNLIDELASGSRFTLLIPELNSHTEYEFKGKDLRDAWDKPREYLYEISGVQGKRIVSPKKQERSPVFLD